MVQRKAHEIISDNRRLLVTSTRLLLLTAIKHTTSTKKSCLELKLVDSSWFKVVYLHSAKKLVRSVMLSWELISIWTLKSQLLFEVPYKFIYSILIEFFFTYVQVLQQKIE